MAKTRRLPKGTITITYSDDSTASLSVPTNMIANLASVIADMYPHALVVAEANGTKIIATPDVKAMIAAFGGSQRLGGCSVCGYGHAAPPPKPRHKKLADVVAEAQVDTSTLTDKELHAHYKRTAPIEDLKFFLRTVTLSPALKAAGDALLADAPNLNRSMLYQRLVPLQDAWRQESNIRNREMKKAA